MQPQFTPSTDNREFSTGAIRGEDNQRGTFSLMPFHALSYIALAFGGMIYLPVDACQSLALLYQAGAKKYAARNWEKGIPLAAYVDSAWRHYRKLRKGMTDEVHATQFAWNILCYVQTTLWIAQGKLPETLNTFPDASVSEPIAAPKFDVTLMTCDDKPMVYCEKAWRALTSHICGCKDDAHLLYAGAYALAFLQKHLEESGEADKLPS